MTMPKTRSEARRFIKAGAVTVNGEKCFDPNYVTKVGDLITVGKGHKFLVVETQTPSTEGDCVHQNSPVTAIPTGILE